MSWTNLMNPMNAVRTEKMPIIGHSVLRQDALSKVTGRAKYAADLEFPRMLHAKVVRTPCAHARIKQIFFDEVLRMPGVVAVLAPDDVPGTFGDDTWVQVFVRNRARSYADALAVVAAESEQTAIEASKKVRIDYEEMPAVFDVEEAISPDAPILHGERNLFHTHRIRKGDVSAGFRESDLVLERTYVTPFAEHAYLEPETATGVLEPDGRITVYGSIKTPFDVRRMVAKILDTGLDRIRIVPVTLGGYFGGKDEDMALMACRVALLAKRTGRPVRISNTREDSLLESTKRHRYVMKYKVGAKKDGRLTAMDIEILADAGAYSMKTPHVTFRSCAEATGPYEVPHVRVDVHSVFTNNNNSGAFRGFGSPQVDFAVESMMDELAEGLGMDPYEFRSRNAFTRGSRTATGQALEGSVTLRQCMDLAVEKSRWYERRSAGPEGTVRRGLGFAASFRGISLGGASVDTAGALVSIQEDARVLVSCGMVEGGQGPQTVLCQICADTLGIPLDKVHFQDWDTSSVPDSGPTVASRATLVGGNAIKRACEQLLEEIFLTVSEVLDVPSHQLTCADGVIHSGTDPNLRFRFEEAVAECRKRGRRLVSIGWYKVPSTGITPETGQGRPFFKYVFGADVAEVEVDSQTGSVRLLKYVSVHDVGRAINPELVAGQIYGGVCMGLGMALFENYTLVNRRPENLNLDQYKTPTALDMGDVTVVVVEGNLEEGPFGASSIGEPACQIVAPAIMNAVAHATGRRVYRLPADWERVLHGDPLERCRQTG
jgi:CO/xanthine dehydrogenase Mo-binding subunit